TAALMAAALFAASAPAAPKPAADPAEVVAAERAFAARAAEIGIAPSFLEFMTDQAVIFRPEPMLARAVYEAVPPAKTPKEGGTRLNWWPNFAGVARSGDLGFTTGPATVNGGKPGIFYFTVWAKQRDGRWKWLYDGGVDADGGAAPGEGVAPIVLPPGDAKPLAPDVAMDQVSAAEIALAAKAKTDVAAAYHAALAPDARMQGSKLAPATTPAAVDQELATRAKAIAFGPIGGSASKAGDLAWTYGDARWDTGRGHYVRVWQRRGGRWRIVFDQIIAVEKAG
ncbi:MAG: nuclear transport factor 2 family protein, partial [Proteobacteria bacterium]|nr:nuclear transport factor 2 family protein [Pseudomonadota bacterium]